MENDRQLVERCLAGEVNAFHGLVERYREPVYRVVYRFLRDHHDALEISQEAFARGWEKLDRYDVERPFSAWILSIASNLSRDLLRKRKRRPLVLDGERAAEVPDLTSPAKSASQVEEAELLRELVGELDDEKRMAVVLRYFEGMSLKKISEITGTAVNTLKVRLFRARKELLRRLDGE